MNRRRPVPWFARRSPRLARLLFVVMHWLVGKRRIVRTQGEMADALRHLRRWDVIEVADDVDLPRPVVTRQMRRQFGRRPR